MKISSLRKTKTNPFYNPSMAFDGGGYYQPQITAEWDNGWTVVAEDTSCGGFGSRWSITVYAEDGTKVGGVYYNAMDGDCRPSVLIPHDFGGWCFRHWGSYQAAHTFRLLVEWALDWLESRFHASIRKQGDFFSVEVA